MSSLFCSRSWERRDGKEVGGYSYTVHLVSEKNWYIILLQVWVKGYLLPTGLWVQNQLLHQISPPMLLKLPEVVLALAMVIRQRISLLRMLHTSQHIKKPPPCQYKEAEDKQSPSGTISSTCVLRFGFLKVSGWYLSSGRIAYVTATPTGIFSNV